MNVCSSLKISSETLKSAYWMWSEIEDNKWCSIVLMLSSTVVYISWLNNKNNTSYTHKISVIFNLKNLINIYSMISRTTEPNKQIKAKRITCLLYTSRCV